MRTDARAQVLGRFRWIEGHADVWHVFRDPVALRAVVQALADPFRAAGVTAVASVKSRGFLVAKHDSVSHEDRVLLVDDWVETGSQALALQSLLETHGTTLLGLSVLVDALPETRRAALPPVHGVIRVSDLPTELATR